MAIKIIGTTVIDDTRKFIPSSIEAQGTVGIAGSILSSTGTGIQWIGAPGGFSVSNDTTTNATYYPVFVNQTTGNPSQISVSSTKLTFNPSTGNLVVGGTVTANSDESLKVNIKTIDNALDKVLSLRGVEYDRVDIQDHQIGVIAQEVEKIVPDVVYPKQESPDYEIKSVAYSNLIGLLIEAIKEQNLKISDLEKRLGES